MREIKTAEEWEQAIERIDELMKLDPDLDTKEGQELDQLADAVVAYEDIHFPMGAG